jgi:hypothetical protein
LHKALRSETEPTLSIESVESKLCAAYCDGIRPYFLLKAATKAVFAGLDRSGPRPHLSQARLPSTLTCVSPMQHEQNWLAKSTKASMPHALSYGIRIPGERVIQTKLYRLNRLLKDCHRGAIQLPDGRQQDPTIDRPFTQSSPARICRLSHGSDPDHLRLQLQAIGSSRVQVSAIVYRTPFFRHPEVNSEIS